MKAIRVILSFLFIFLNSNDIDMRIIISFLFLFLLGNISAQGTLKDTTVVLTENIYFDFGKDEIRSSEISKLNTLANSLKSHYDGYIKLTGHTDSIGTNNNNLSLSERRSKAVIDYLINQRIAPFSFIMRYDGELIPVADNATEDGRQMNRRVEITVHKINTIQIPEPVVEKTKEEPLTIEEKENTLPITFIIKDEDTNNFIENAAISEPQIKQKLNTNKGKWKGNLELELSTPYVFSFHAKGYFHNSEEITIEDYSPRTIEIKLKPIKKGNKLALKKLYFYGNEARLLPKSMPELRRLKESVLLNPDVKLEVGGHINYPNTHPDDVPQWSVDLSVKRAKVIYKYLVDSGVNEKQLTFKGYSNTQMINPTAREEKYMAPNRRVEIKVMGYLE